ncbi:MAG TPA: ABC transporter substrate-binding protein [Thermomicrobiales bacterium]|nr:ABC transporter substrate-binding protein [Thermomicrobiales bacterium]
MTDHNQHDSVSALIQDACAQRTTRRDILRRGAALGMATTMIGAMITVNAAPAFAQDAETIVIGCPYNLTGALQSIDVPAKDGSLLAAKLLNANGGVLGKQVTLVVENGESDLTTVTTITKKMVDQDHVIGFAGLTDTDYVRAAGQVAQENKLPFVNVGATAPILAQIGNFIFFVPFGDNVQAAVAAEFAKDQGWMTAAMLVNDGTSYTKFLAQYFKERYTMDDLGGQVLKELSYKAEDTDFSSQITDIKAMDPQPSVIFASAVPFEVGTLVKQIRDAGLTLPILGGDGYDTPSLLELAGDKAVDVYFTTHEGIYGDQSPESKTFTEAFTTEYGKGPDSIFAALGYDGINLLCDAITRAGDTDGEKVREALSTTTGFKGATGEISFVDGSQIPSKSVAIVVTKDGKFELVKTTVPTKVPEA